ncbi:hypothetical protein [Fischerella thermalis]|nr:hypothetical protein [Fischerella thermalis]
MALAEIIIKLAEIIIALAEIIIALTKSTNATAEIAMVIGFW